MQFSAFPISPQWALQQGRAGARRARGGVPAAEHAGAATDPPTPRGTRVRRTKLNESRCGLESSAATALLRVGWRLLKAPPLPPSAPSPPPVVRWGDQRPSLFLCPPTGARADVVAGTPAPSTVAATPREGLGRGQTGWVFSGEDQSPPPVALSARAAVNRFASADQGHGVAATPPGQDGRSPSLTWTGDGGGSGIVGR